MKSSTAIRRDVPTAKEVRDFLGHGQGTRKVRVRRDGSIGIFGSCLPGPTGFAFWRQYGHASDLMVNSRKQVQEQLQRGQKDIRREQ